MGGRHIESFLPSRRVAAAALAIALACCAVSLAARREVQDLRSAMLGVFETDSRALVRYSKAAAGQADANAMSRLIETDIVPAFARERARLASFGPVRPEQSRILADLQQYVVLREEFWRQRAASAGSTDDEARRRIEAADRAADTVMRRLLEAR
jgi:hypothetical protein